MGKSTFFKAATLKDVAIADYPFTTIEPNLGVGHVRTKCACRDFNMQCTPLHGSCLDGTRFVPIELVDVAGLVRGAHQGRGLGNQFLDNLRQADAFLHVLDASGATNEEGQAVPAGTHDPASDVAFLEEEIDWWVVGILNKDWLRLAKRVETTGDKIDSLLKQQLTGLGVTDAHLHLALRQAPVDPAHPSQWGESGLLSFSQTLRTVAKPGLLVLNKADRTPVEQMKALQSRLAGRPSVPTGADAEVALRGAAKAGLIDYAPGGADYRVQEGARPSARQAQALEFIRDHVLKPYGATGVLQALEHAVFQLLKLMVVFPVEDDHRLTDKSGNILPDAHLLPQGATAKDLAFRVHTDLGEHFIRAIDVRHHRTIGADHALQHGDVVRIVANV